MSNGDEKILLVESLERDGDLQLRVNLDEDGIEALKEAYLNDDKVPPVSAIFDGEKYYLTDGHRRCAAKLRTGKKQIQCIVKHGTKRDALLEVCRANMEHDRAGLRRTNQDKRRAVTRLLNDEEWTKWSDSKIADYVGVSVSFIGTVRKELASQEGSPIDLSAPREGLDGKTRKPRTVKPKSEPTNEDVERAELDHDEFDPVADLPVSSEVDSEPPFDPDFVVSNPDSSFSVDDLKPPKNGREIQDFPHEAKLQKMYGELARLLDDRLECVGGNVTLKNKCTKALSESFAFYKEWCGQ